MSLYKSWSWWRLQLQDLLELFLLPGLAAVLPWRICFSLYRQLAKFTWLYRGATDAAWPWVQQTMPELVQRQWAYERRLLTLVDHADCVLSCTRSARWARRHVQVIGHWPRSDAPQVICTFHWGAGMWTLQAMRQAGLSVHALAASLEGAQFTGRPVLHRYARWRTAQVVKALGYSTIDVNASMRPVMQALKNNHSVLGVLDVPADNVEASVAVPLLGHSVQVPRGLLRLAAERQLPVTLFMAGLDFKTGHRTWVIHSLGVVSDAPVLFDKVFGVLSQSIKASPSAWHLWAEMPRFLHNKD